MKLISASATEGVVGFLRPDGGCGRSILWKDELVQFGLTRKPIGPTTRAVKNPIDIYDNQSQNVQSGVVEIEAPCEGIAVVQLSQCMHYFQRPRISQTSRICAHDNQCAKLH